MLQALSQNIIVRQRGRRIIGKTYFGDLKDSSDFQFTYYHLSSDHVVRKNSIFDNSSYVYVSPEAFTYFNYDLKLKTVVCKAGLVLVCKGGLSL